jgi:hypothetical protein
MRTRTLSRIVVTCSSVSLGSSYGLDIGSVREKNPYS